ncbi:hypothetical protein TetV_076 [Tetraselmis virus 1]|uniref:Uncharacterized protein n=1 Tax=Tetraselmis virus 1 TaxID=2060617 RepID=A0A2P0VMN5_9VIRU|nr:hypothetical protein QJ968_gp076 [Tetraselmis virus 1]AUF82168.1 hypothetical protein TetV_076 [Tetraselmis virus 1]
MSIFNIVYNLLSEISGNKDVEKFYNELNERYRPVKNYEFEYRMHTMEEKIHEYVARTVLDLKSENELLKAEIHRLRNAASNKNNQEVESFNIPDKEMEEYNDCIRQMEEEEIEIRQEFEYLSRTSSSVSIDPEWVKEECCENKNKGGVWNALKRALIN